ncbi:magnesium transporter [Aestuariibacter sp. AA17]|uniref:Magnesium transporter n=1 Tax=Fluctibacter corallii TaxID=2984329 RepID=A0ABT3AD57_9ALTE|nr:magnesium transporter [Aestuariibacter sp. AA17]MCV2886609.1 magnesium transporter [Aestuariibacter sp. AA17]
MSANEAVLDQATFELTQTFIKRYPGKSARFLERMSAPEAAQILQCQPVYLVAIVWRFLPASSADDIFVALDSSFGTDLMSQLDIHIAATLMGRLDEDTRHNVMATLSESLQQEIADLLVYPDNTAGRMMTTHVHAFSGGMRVKDVLQHIKHRKLHSQDVLFVLDAEQHLVGEVELHQLIQSSANARLEEIASDVKTTLNALDSNDEVVEKFEAYRGSALAVLNLHRQLVGMIRFIDVYQTTKEDLATDMQTMVGVSKEERALSTSWFSVKKRLPWLQVNLLTAFAAASVVGAFEGLISEITALAILLPVAAGQSGNAGAQALAVTMRGLTLREITTRHWSKVLSKEMMTGLLNGLAVAITCALGVYVWSQSLGLTAVIAIAMVVSLTIACSAGALVPIILKKSGLDPAQSSSIVLTTVTDIAGFMSFLGIALLLSDYLPRG